MGKVSALVEYNWNKCSTTIARYYVVMIRVLILLLLSFIYYYLLVFRNPRITQLDLIISRNYPFRPLCRSSLLHINGTRNQMGHFKDIYIINLEKRSNRRTNMIALMQALDLDSYIVPAHTINSPEVISRSYLARNAKITLVELACWASHMQVWAEIANHENDETWSLVFEDDIDLEADTLTIIESFPEDLWQKPDLVYLGSCGNIAGSLVYKGIKGYRIHRALNPSCTHAYAIRSNAARKLQRLLSVPRRAIDDEIVLLTNYGKLNVYSIHPPLAIQAPATFSNPSDVNPKSGLWKSKVKLWINFIIGWWRGAEFERRLRNSTLATVDLNKALEWRRKNEKKDFVS